MNKTVPPVWFTMPEAGLPTLKSFAPTFSVPPKMPKVPVLFSKLPTFMAPRPVAPQLVTSSSPALTVMAPVNVFAPPSVEVVFVLFCVNVTLPEITPEADSLTAPPLMTVRLEAVSCPFKFKLPPLTVVAPV